jgi:hypothetical protein
MIQNTLTLKQRLVPKGRILYFDEEAHKYTDDINTIYTSTTTVIGKYHEKFDASKVEIAKACEHIGHNPRHPKYLKYAGKTAKQLLYEWDEETIRACKKGTAKHNYLETHVKNCNGYTLNANGFINGQIYTIDSIIKGHNYGRLSLEFFKKTGIDQKYPTIYGIIADFVNQGFKIYAEIGVYDSGFRISGLIDILLVRGNEFIILDWKTNKAPIRFESGYYDKDNNGKLLLDQFIYQDKYFYTPLSHLADSIGNHYTMQLSTYDYLVETFGFKCLGNILCHIRTIESDVISHEEEKEEVKFLPIAYLRSEVEAMLMDNIAKCGIKQTLF